MNSHDTIVAISSAVGAGARMIVRVSGPTSIAIAEKISPMAALEGNAATRCVMHFDGLIVPGWIYAFCSPRSYTGEDLVEFHIPGNPVLARMLLKSIIATGARHAEPGEFTSRAFFNGRIGLTEAEGVAATIAAGGAQELSAARRLLAGELARRLMPVMEAVAQTLALVEAGIDFSDEEDVRFQTSAQVLERVGAADRDLADLVSESARFERLSHEPQFVLVGRPNAGKSTLLNALAGRERAVTSPIAGTTRDVLTAEIMLARGIVRLTDAAGIEATGTTDDATEPSSVHADIDRQMRRQALRALESADHVLMVRDQTDSRPTLSLARSADLTIFTKTDLRQPGSITSIDDRAVSISAVTGENVDQLRDRLDRLAFGPASGSSTLALNARHLKQIEETRAALRRAADHARQDSGPELIALELREALDALGSILGRVTPDDLLGRIFSAFCIGK